jgi:hypothetical protein
MSIDTDDDMVYIVRFNLRAGEEAELEQRPLSLRIAAPCAQRTSILAEQVAGRVRGLRVPVFLVVFVTRERV